MKDLSGLKALVVEDDGNIALLIETMLEDIGCEVAASLARLSEACRVARVAAVDFAVLDVNLDGQPAFPIAELLRERRIPFVFSTGYGASGIPPEFREYPVVAKPFGVKELQRGVLAALS